MIAAEAVFKAGRPCLWAGRFLVYFIFRVGIHCQSRKHRNLKHIRPKHHMGQPDGVGTDVPEIKIGGGIQDICLKADRSGGQDTVKPDTDLTGQSHVDDDRKNTEQKRGGKARHNIFKPGRKKYGKAGYSQQAKQPRDGHKSLKLSYVHVRKIDNRI